MNLNWRYFYQKVRRTWYGRGERNSVRERTGVNFTDVLLAAFTYVSCAPSFFVPTFYILVLYFTGVSLPSQKCWWNWALMTDDLLQIFSMFHFQFETRAGITEDLPFTSFIRPPPPFTRAPFSSFLCIIYFYFTVSRVKRWKGRRSGMTERELEGSWEEL